MTIKPVASRPSLPFVPKKPGRFKDLKVPGRRRPGVLERAGDLTGRHRPALEVHRE